MADELDRNEVLALVREIVEDEQKLECYEKRQSLRFNINDARAFAYKRIANLILPHSERIT